MDNNGLQLKMSNFNVYEVKSGIRVIVTSRPLRGCVS